MTSTRPNPPDNCISPNSGICMHLIVIIFKKTSKAVSLFGIMTIICSDAPISPTVNFYFPVNGVHAK